MSGKRQATSDLNHDNWDREEEPEDRGTFRTAPSDELKNRVIKKASRRKLAGGASTDDTDGGNVTKSVFSGFAGFSTTPASTAAVSPFSFLSKIPAVAVTEAGSGGSNSKTTPKPSFSFGGAATAASPKTTAAESVAESKKPNPEISSPPKAGEKSSSYYAKLKGLNRALSEWVKTHVDKNPLCILTPIFKDYEQHLSDIGKEESDKSTSVGEATAFKFATTPSAAATQVSIAPPATTASTFSFGSSSTFAGTAATTTTSTTSIFGGSSKATSEAPKSNGFSFGLKSDDKAKAAAPSGMSGFSFGNSASSSSAEKKPSGFSFTPGSTPFSFGNIKPSPAAPASTAQTGEEDEEDEPPKVEFKQVVEEDAVYSKKCKVFVKKGGNFADRGVGTLYLKPVKDSEKTQLLVRADTNLGNILVNLILNAALPAQRMGKNNVMLVCLPTPEADKPTSMLMRVKTGEEADELLAAIEKYKK